MSTRRGRRRGNGEGSVCRRRDGRWIAALTLGRDEQGRPIRRTVYARSQREALEKLQRLRNADPRSAAAARPRSLADFLEEWLENAKRPSVSRSTYRSYRGVLRKYVLPALGELELGAVAPVHIQRLYAAMEKAGASPRLRVLVHAVLRQALRQAVRWELLDRNPCDAVTPPKARRREAAYLDAAQTHRLLLAARGEPLETLCVLAVTTGLRQGELLGLRWG